MLSHRPRPRRAFHLAATLTLLLAACRSPTGSPGDPTGSWHAREALQPAGTMERILRFDPDGRYEHRTLDYGIYGQPASKLSAYVSETGHYTRTANQLVLQAEADTTWDSEFYPRPIIRDISAHPPFEARYELSGDELVLYYLSYPADAPVPTTMRLRRLR